MSGSRTAIGMSVTAAGGENVSLEAGTHRYPFMFFLPPTVPSSFEGEVGHVRYTVEATMERPRWRSNRVTRSAFTVISVVDLNLQPLEFRVIAFVWSLTLNATILSLCSPKQQIWLITAVYGGCC